MNLDTALRRWVSARNRLVEALAQLEQLPDKHWTVQTIWTVEATVLLTHKGVTQSFGPEVAKPLAACRLHGAGSPRRLARRLVRYGKVEAALAARLAPQLAELGSTRPDHAKSVTGPLEDGILAEARYESTAPDSRLVGITLTHDFNAYEFGREFAELVDPLAKPAVTEQQAPSARRAA